MQSPSTRKPKLVFNSSHEFWKTAVSMRRDLLPYSAIVAKAKALGYDLSYKQVANGLGRVASDFDFPPVTYKNLRVKWQEAAKSFDSYMAMKDLAQYAFTKIAELEDELLDDDCSAGRQDTLQNEIWRWYGRAYEWASGCTAASLKMKESGFLDDNDNGYKVLNSPEDIKKLVDAQIAEIQGRLPTQGIDLIAEYGETNIRNASDVTSEENPDDEEEE